MIASVLPPNIAFDVRKHCFRWPVAVIPSTASRRLRAMAWANQDVCIPKPCPNPMGFDKKL